MSLAFVLGFLVGTPPGSASHWTVHESGLDDSARRTSEDDGEIVRAAGNVLDGRQNHVVEAGRAPGDGALLLDARTATRAGTNPLASGGEHAGLDLFPLAIAGPLLGVTNSRLPGPEHTSAWYGWWFDADDDVVIDDVHDAACAGAPCGGDEFAWRGAASGENVAIVFTRIPASGIGAIAMGNATAIGARALLDRTDPSRPSQEWIGGELPATVDAGFLARVQYFTLAGARPAPGAPLGYDVDDPAALWDVDTFEAVSSDVESLWVSNARAAGAAITAAQSGDELALVDMAIELGVAKLNEVLNAVNPAYDDIEDRVVEAGTFVFERDVTPPTPKEPNHAADDFEGRATFDGVTDVKGAFNTYEAYALGHHLWFDNVGELRACPGISVAAAGFTVTRNLACVRGAFDPAATLAFAERSAGPALAFRAHAILWKDINQDRIVGIGCDPDSDGWDAEAGICETPTEPAEPGKERVGVCDVSTARAGEITVRPLGLWGDAILVRDDRAINRALTEEAPRRLEGDEPVRLRYSATCDSPQAGDRAGEIQSRDAILFPGGANESPLLVSTRVAIAGFVDVSLGIDVGSESVEDVDLIPAVL